MNILTHIAQSLQTVYPQGEAKAMARIVLEDCFGLSQTDILLGKDSELSADDRKELQNIVQRLLSGEPLQYVVGFTYFCGRQFAVRPGCLIPRPETQQLALLAAEQKGSVLDIGTGSGCIAITLALQGREVCAWDVSAQALEIAKENAQALGADVQFEKKDILQIRDDQRRWDNIVSNPPYVRRSESSSMSRNVLDHEPHLALFVPDDDPLLFYRAIGQFAISHLVRGGHLLLEINQFLANETAQMLERKGFAHLSVLDDQFGNPRIINCQCP